MKKARSCY